jgi:VWFA-related protein
MMALAAIAASILFPVWAGAENLYLRGKVTLADGSPPGRMVSIEQVCHGSGTKIIATAAKSGDYIWRTAGGPLGLDVFTSSGLGGTSVSGSGVHGAGPVTAGLGVGDCVLRANLQGFRSTTIDLMDRTLFREPQLPVLVLEPKRPGAEVELDRPGVVPSVVSKDWANAERAMQAGKWPEAERQLLKVVATDPNFRTGWVALGLACQNQGKASEARDAFRSAVALDPKPLDTHLMLAQASLGCRDWEEASRTAGALITADTKHRYLNAYLVDAIARYHLQDLDRAEARAKELLQLDKPHQIPRAEYVLGLILEARKDIATAGEHMRRYLELQPAASDAKAVRARIETLGQPRTDSASDEIDAPNLTLADPGETFVPGGLKAFATIARLENTPDYDNFFLEYCRRILLDASPFVDDHVPQYSAQIHAFSASLAELMAAGRQRDEHTSVVTLSMTGASERAKTARLLRCLGWKLDETGSSPRVELGDEPDDGLRQPIAAALGIDEIAMRNALNVGRSFEFEVRSETARLVGGIRWAAVLKGIPSFPGGMADVFARDPQFAKAYAGLGALSVENALGLISAIGVRDLVTRYSDVLALCSGAFNVSSGGVSTPGGPEALSVWKKLVGADPAEPTGFFRALLAKDGGRLAVFYFTLSQVDAKHQRFFTADAARAQRFYEWRKESPDMQVLGAQMPGNWRRDLFGRLPLEESGRVRFPGGRAAWSASPATDDEVLLRSEWIEALVPVASLEEKRGAPLDETSARLLARHFAEWRSLFPYFEKLPELGSAEFEALVTFTEAASGLPLDARNTLVGEWHSLMKLIVLGTQAGSLDRSAAARAFAQVCTALAGPDPSSKALAVLRDIAGGQGSVDEAVPTRLLRLSGPHRAGFERIRESQKVPSIDAVLAAPTAAATLAALSGLVYAAVLDPAGLLVSEDPEMLSRHRFIARSDPANRTLFFPTALVRTEGSSASYMTGGFMTFEDVDMGLARHKRDSETYVTPADTGRVTARPAPAAAPVPLTAEAVFRASARLVEVYATVTDGRGRYVDDLPRAEFALLDNGKPVNISSFENRSSAVSVALLFDATGSMQSALPALKSAALRLISELRPADAVAVYSFNAEVTELQPFTADKRAAERAVLRPHALGGTALYDALVRVNHDLAGRVGKKAIVVFTDGEDNASTLTAAIAIARAKAAGSPIYTIAQGAALTRSQLLEQLAGISNSTGGLSFAIHGPGEILKVFESVSKDLTHGYLLTFQPPHDDGLGWHSIKVTLRAAGGRTVRAREGYSLE